ncbi:MAG: cytochrome c oxidase subunit I [Candidatus Xenobia bacterium]
MSVAVEHAGGVPKENPYAGGLWSWLTTVDHKRIGILYGVSALFFLMVGGIEALLIRIQLAVPENTFIGGEMFNQLFTMHGTTMIFLAIMPMGAAFFNFIIPLQIGARDVAFPRLNAFSYWMFLAGAIFINISWFTGEAPNGGWFGYANNTEKLYNPGHGVDFWIFGLQILGVASLVAALNFLTTIINMRAPGMTMMRLPVFTWMTLVTSFLIILAFPVITIALAELMMDRFFGTNFFIEAKGGLPIVWQHLFWVFGHPEVYILILPAMGIVSEVLPVFSKKPLFGYPVIVFSGVAIGFLGFTVWSHHMFTTGLGAIANAAFALTTMTIAIPTGVKIFNWVGTMWGGKIHLRAPMMYAVGFIAMFMMGGLGGIMHASPPSDAQQQDTYFIVGHIHYVLIGGSLMALLAGIHYWFPKITGRMYNEVRAKVGFWLLFVGLNLLAIPMHLLGVDGMPRRIFTYADGMGWNGLNMAATIGAFTIAIAVALTLHNLGSALRKGEVAGNDPWDGRTLEWMLPSPPPVYNFEKIPVVHHLDDFWYQKHPDLAHGEAAASEEAAHEEHGEHEDHIHMPPPSYWPLVSSIGVFVGALLMVFAEHKAFALIGVVILIFGVLGWAFEDVGPLHEWGTTKIENRKMMMWAFLGSDCMFFGALISTYLIYHGKSLVGPFPKETFNITTTSQSSFILLMSSLMMVLTLGAIKAGKMPAFRIYCFLTALFGCIFLGYQYYEFSHFSRYWLFRDNVPVQTGADLKLYQWLDKEPEALAEALRGHSEDATNTDALKGVPGVDDYTKFLTDNPDVKANLATTSGKDSLKEYHKPLWLATNLYGSTFFTLTGTHGCHVAIGVIWLLTLLIGSFKTSGHNPIKPDETGCLTVEVAGLYWHFVDIVWIVIFTVVYLLEYIG